MSFPTDGVIVQIFESPAPFGGVSIDAPFQQQITFGGAVSNQVQDSVRWEYHPLITTLRGGAPTAMDAFDFRQWLPNSLMIIVIDPGTGKERQEWLVVSGQGSVGNDGHIVLVGYNSVTNNKHLERVA